jgi:hypothetical protein
MARGRSTFTKRQKEQARQQRQRDKAERRNQRKQEKSGLASDDEMSVLREHAEAQAALFHVGPAGSNSAEPSDDDSNETSQGA